VYDIKLVKLVSKAIPPELTFNTATLEEIASELGLGPLPRGKTALATRKSLVQQLKGIDAKALGPKLLAYLGEADKAVAKSTKQILANPRSALAKINTRAADVLAELYQLFSEAHPSAPRLPSACATIWLWTADRDAQMRYPGVVKYSQHGVAARSLVMAELKKHGPKGGPIAKRLGKLTDIDDNEATRVVWASRMAKYKTTPSSCSAYIEVWAHAELLAGVEDVVCQGPMYWDATAGA
jgi:hypothetical protein